LNALPASVQGQNGSAALMAAARIVCWGFGLGRDRGLGLLIDHFNPRCQPEWSERELEHKCDEAMHGADRPFGWLLQDSYNRSSQSGTASRSPTREEIAMALAVWGDSPRSTSEPTFAGYSPQRDLNASWSEPAAHWVPRSTSEPTFATGVDPDDPRRLAELFLHQYVHVDGYRLRYYQSEWLLWEHGVYTEVDQEHIVAALTDHINAEYDRIHQAAIRTYEIARERGDANLKVPTRNKITTGVIANVMLQVRAATYLRRAQEPCWLDRPDAQQNEVIAFPNGLLHLGRFCEGRPGAFAKPTPRFFTRTRRDFEFDAASPRPARWLAFLSSVWPGGPENDTGSRAGSHAGSQLSQSVECLQEWLGYLLTSETKLQKILAVIGPKRSGKGTIREVVKGLVGSNSVANIALGDLATPFGLVPLIGRSVAIFGDARLSGRQDAVQITERLVGISGEDPQNVNRKHKSSIDVKLTTRFVLFSNEIPRLTDSSTALASRMCILEMTQSWLGKEDHGLTESLRAELPGIFLWAVEGYQRLARNRRFTEPAESAAMVAEFRAMSSPITQFVDDWCELVPGHFEATEDLYQGWCKWCQKHGQYETSSAVFVRDLRAAFSEVQPKRIGTEVRQRGYVGVRLMNEYERGSIPD